MLTVSLHNKASVCAVVVPAGGGQPDVLPLPLHGEEKTACNRECMKGLKTRDCETQLCDSRG